MGRYRVSVFVFQFKHCVYDTLLCILLCSGLQLIACSAVLLLTLVSRLRVSRCMYSHCVVMWHPHHHSVVLIHVHHHQVHELVKAMQITYAISQTFILTDCTLSLSHLLACTPHPQYHSNGARTIACSNSTLGTCSAETGDDDQATGLQYSKATQLSRPELPHAYMTQ